MERVMICNFEAAASAAAIAPEAAALEVAAAIEAAMINDDDQQCFDQCIWLNILLQLLTDNCYKAQ